MLPLMDLWCVLSLVLSVPITNNSFKLSVLVLTSFWSLALKELVQGTLPFKFSVQVQIFGPWSCMYPWTKTLNLKKGTEPQQIVPTFYGLHFGFMIVTLTYLYGSTSLLQLIENRLDSVTEGHQGSYTFTQFILKNTTHYPLPVLFKFKYEYKSNPVIMLWSVHYGPCCLHNDCSH